MKIMPLSVQLVRDDTRFDYLYRVGTFHQMSKQSFNEDVVVLS